MARSMKQFVSFCWTVWATWLIALPLAAEQLRTAEKQMVLETELDSIVLEAFPEKVPFSDASEDELSAHRVVIKTDLGEIEIAFFAEDATEHVRQFLTFAKLGLYDGTPIHRVVPSFVIQGGSLSMREEPVPAKSHHLLKKLEPEFSNRRHVRGAVSMARGAEQNSAMDSFFIVLEDQPRLDGEYTVFGEVVRGLDVVDMISLQPLAGERLVKPLQVRMEVIRAQP